MSALYEIFKMDSRLFLNCLEGMSEDQARWRPSAATNHAAFIAVHMVDARHYLAKLVGLALDYPFEEAVRAAKSIDDLRSWPSVDQLRTAWKAVTGELRERFKQLGPDDLAKPVETRFPVESRTVLGVTAFLMQHEAYHLGMLSLLRKQVGLPAMGY